MLLNLIGHMCLFGYENSGKEIELDLTKKKKALKLKILGSFVALEVVLTSYNTAKRKEECISCYLD